MYCFLPVVPPLLVSGPPPQESMIPVLSSRGWGKLSAASSFPSFLASGLPRLCLSSLCCPLRAALVCFNAIRLYGCPPSSFHPPIPLLILFSFLPRWAHVPFSFLFPSLPPLLSIHPSVRPSGPFNCARKQNRPFDRPTKK